ncbi:MAG: HPF/RaiA family ribosome-associated protein [Thermoanaerobaculia bacterium]
MAKNRENMGGPTQGRNDTPTDDRNNEKQPSGMSAQSQSSPIADEERSNRDGDPLSDHGVSRRSPRPDDSEEDTGQSASSQVKPIDVQVNTDSSIDGTEALIANVEASINSGLARFAERITRVEVHLSDQNAGKGGTDDKRCMLEARLEGLQPIAVTDTSGTIVQAVDGAVGKLKRAIQSTLGKLRDNRPSPDLDADAPGM